MFLITATCLLVMDWRLGLCVVVPVPVAALVVFAARKAQAKAESANMDAKRAAYDGVQEYLDTIQELKSCSREDEYLAGLEQKLDNVVRYSFRNEIAPGAATTTAQFILRFGLVAVLLVGGYLVAARFSYYSNVYSISHFCRKNLRPIYKLFYAYGRSIFFIGKR